MSLRENVLDALADLRRAADDIESAVAYEADNELEEAAQRGYDEGRKDGERLVQEYGRALIAAVDQMRRQAVLPYPLHPGVMTLDEVEKMIREVMER